MPPHVPLHDGLGELADAYDAFILDLWGVLHDGVEAYPRAVDCLRRLKAAGKTTLVLSNAPRQTSWVAERMRQLGLTDDLYDKLMSSGEDAWRHLRERPCAWYRALGERMFHLGPPRDAGMREGLDVVVVEDLGEADFILNTGPIDPDGDLPPLEPLLHEALERRLPMICANPDLIVMRGGAREICAGAVAARYEALGGEVQYHGKPYRKIYDTCFELLGHPERARVCAVGDSLHTDIAGANAIGIDSILVTGGIHGETLGVRMGQRPDPEALAELCRREEQVPSAALPEFRW